MSEGMSMDDWRGAVCEELRDDGYEWLADEFGGLSDEAAQVYRDWFDDPAEAALALTVVSEYES